MNRVELVQKILSGKSKVSRINDYEILDIFRQQLTPHHVLTSPHYQYDGKKFYHDNDLELIKRDKDNLIFRNSELAHFKSGFFGGSSNSCPPLWDLRQNIIRLPLTTIKEQITNKTDNKNFMDIRSTEELIEDIEIIKIGDWEQGTLFKIDNKMCWFKPDERQECLIILPIDVTDFNQANECLKPKIMENMGPENYKRVGDYYFIETTEDFKDYDKLHYERGQYFVRQGYGNIMQFNEVIEKTKELFPLTQKFDNPQWEEIFNDVLNRLIRYTHREDYAQIKELNDLIIKKLDPQQYKTKLQRYDIYDSNHTADNSANINNVQFVKGYVYHKNRDHIRYKFDKWFMVLKNEQIDAFNVSANGGYRD